MLEGLFIDILMISFTTSFIILGLVLLSPLMSKRYSAKWTYWIWLIIAIRLLFPFNFSFTDNLIDIQVPIQTTVQSTMENENVQQLTPPINMESEMNEGSMTNEQTVTSGIQLPSLVEMLSWVWVVGLVTFLLYHLASYLFFRKQALRWSYPLSSEHTLSKAKQIFEEMKINRPIPIRTSEKVPNPMLVGFWKPILFLPHENYTDEELEFILKHEFVHYQRRDILHKLLLLVVQAIHWFNPFVWMMVREASREIEINCDNTVVKNRSLTYRKRYCEAILSAIQNKNTPHIPLSTNFSGRQNSIMKKRFISILSTKKKRVGIIPFCTVLLFISALGLLVACTDVSGEGHDLATGENEDSSDSEYNQDSTSSELGTIYSYSVVGKYIVHDAGHSYLLDEKGNVSISYQNGKYIEEVPLKLNLKGTELGMGESETGFYITEQKTAIVYGFADGETSPLHVLISDDRGKTWNEYTIPGSKGYDTKFIGFTSEEDGWIVAGGSAGVGRSLNQIYQTSDGGKTWEEIENMNDVYSEHLTGASFPTKDIGFLGFRYYMDNGPVIYKTTDRGKSWEKLSIEFPEKLKDYRKNPLSPVFNGKEGEGVFPISVRGEEGEKGMIYLTSKDYVEL